MVFHWSPSDSKSTQVSRTLLSIISDLNNAVAWTLSTRLPISHSSRSLAKPSGIIPSTQNIVGITVTFMLYSSGKVQVLVSRFLWFSFKKVSKKLVKSTIRQVLFSFFFSLLLIRTRPGCLVMIRGSVCISKSQKILFVSFSRTNSGLCIYHLAVCPNFKFLHNSQWISFPTQLCLVLYSLSAILLHLLIMWLIVSSLSPHNLHLLFCYVLLLFLKSFSHQR